MSRTDQELRNLLNSLTLEQKIGQLNMVGGSIYSEFNPTEQDDLIHRGLIGSMMYADPKTNNRLQRRNLELNPQAIPILFCSDVIHGADTNFPLPLAESCSWEPRLAERTAELSAKEASALGVRLTFAPMADLAYDARWGRNVEGAGEDPYLNSLFIAARVRGFQGSNRENIDEHHLGSTIKHFAAYSYVVGGKDYNSSLIDSRTLKIKVMRPYEAGIKAGALAVMPGFNDLDGIPCISNKTLLDDLLRKKWGFDGVIVSDYGSIRQNITQHYANNEEDTTKGALEAGTDIDMESRLYIKHLTNLIKEGRIAIETLDEAVFRVLKLKSRLGLFDSPFTDESREYSEIGTKEALDLAYESACKSIVLLKNQQLLPLQKPIKIALIGPYANTKDDLNGSWSAHRGFSKTQTILEGLSRHVTNLSYSMGIENEALLISEIQTAVNECDVIITAFGIENCLTGEAASLSKLQLSKKQTELFRHLRQFRKPIVALIMSGRPLVFNEIIEQADAVVMGWSLGTRTGDAIADTIFGINNPSGKLTMTFPRTAGQCPMIYNGYENCRPYQKNDYYTSTYRDVIEGPLFPFGYGISYNHYCYGIATLRNCQINIDENIVVNLEITNEGKYLGHEIVQVYVTKIACQPLRPRLELVHFQIEHFKPHEKRTIQLTFPAKNLCYDDENNHGIYQLKIGPNSGDLQSIELEII